MNGRRWRRGAKQGIKTEGRANGAQGRNRISAYLTENASFSKRRLSSGPGTFFAAGRVRLCAAIPQVVHLSRALRKALWQIAPWCAPPQYPEDAVEDTSVVDARHAARLVRKERPDGSPLKVRKFVS
jgi:hypothetical protein